MKLAVPPCNAADGFYLQTCVEKREKPFFLSLPALPKGDMRHRGSLVLLLLLTSGGVVFMQKQEEHIMLRFWAPASLADLYRVLVANGGRSGLRGLASRLGEHHVLWGMICLHPSSHGQRSHHAAGGSRSLLLDARPDGAPA